MGYAVDSKMPVSDWSIFVDSISVTERPVSWTAAESPSGFLRNVNELSGSVRSMACGAPVPADDLRVLS